MQYVIFKNFHRAWPLTLGLWRNKKHLSKTVVFTNSCRYRIKGEDMYDINKLFGIGYFFSHHTDSARFGWRYNPIMEMVEIFSYCFVNKERIDWPLGEIKINHPYELGISVKSDKYFFYVIDIKSNEMIMHETITKTHNKKWSYPLGLYFGGNKKAPHKMKVKFERA